MWRLSPSLRPAEGRSMCAPRPSASHGCWAGGAGGAWLGKVFKPGLALPGGVAGASGVVSHRCRFVAGLPMRAGLSPVLPLCRARSLADVGSGSRVCAWGLLCTVLVGCGGERRMTDETLPSAFAKISSHIIRSRDGCAFLSALDCLSEKIAFWAPGFGPLAISRVETHFSRAPKSGRL